MAFLAFFWSYQQVSVVCFEKWPKFGTVFAVDFPKATEWRIAAVFWANRGGIGGLCCEKYAGRQYFFACVVLLSVQIKVPYVRRKQYYRQA